MSKQNTNCLEGIRCPKCKSLGPFIVHTTESQAVWTDDGVEDYQSPEIGDDSYMTCQHCNYRDEESRFRIDKQVVMEVATVQIAFVPGTSQELQDALEQLSHSALVYGWKYPTTANLEHEANQVVGSADRVYPRKVTGHDIELELSCRDWDFNDEQKAKIREGESE